MDNITSINGSMGWIINGYTIQWLSNDYPEIDGIWTFEIMPMLIRFLKRLQYILLQGDHIYTISLHNVCIFSTRVSWGADWKRLNSNSQSGFVKICQISNGHRTSWSKPIKNSMVSFFPVRKLSTSPLRPGVRETTPQPFGRPSIWGWSAEWLKLGVMASTLWLPSGNLT